MFDKRYTKNCHIYNTLNDAATHTSFHTPGHKMGKWDITELSFSDNLSAPTGCILRAEKDIANILGASQSFILTDGSTAGVLSMLRAGKVRKLLFPQSAHKSVQNACKLLGITPVILEQKYQGNMPMQVTASEIENALCLVENLDVDGVLLTSPDYYGNAPDLQSIKAVCLGYGCTLFIDGAHGAHLRNTPLHAGMVADFWVDGAHKSLPCFTQGAVVSCKSQEDVDALKESVDIFRTTSPNYMIMASVEYGIKYPENRRVIEAANAVKKKYNALINDDWSKAVIRYGSNAPFVMQELEKAGIYAEFCDGENILFYLSPATKPRHLKKLDEALTAFARYQAPAPKITDGDYQRGVRTGLTEALPLAKCEGRTCAKSVGLFPPCIPVLLEGYKITKEQIERLQNARNIYGLTDGKVTVYVGEK